MKRAIPLTLLFLLNATALPLLASSTAEPAPAAAVKHKTTEWRLEPSFTFDLLCFLNTLTGDAFYLRYYQGEYGKFHPQITPEAQQALENLRRKIKDERGNIISAFLTLYFSAVEHKTIDDLLKTIENPQTLQERLRKTPYYSDSGWQLFESVRGELKTVFLFLQDIRFESYWKETIAPKVTQRIGQIQNELPHYDIVPAIEAHLGSPLPSNAITVYVLYYSQPHGIRITGMRFLTDVAWPFRIVLRNAVHEMMHPPFDLAADEELRSTLASLRADEFLMDKVLNHNPAFGYNSFQGFLEEDCVQALEQLITEKLGVARNPHRRWKQNDDGMHVFAVALYRVMKEENYNQRAESFRNFLLRMIRSGKLSAGTVRAHYGTFYSQERK